MTDCNFTSTFVDYTVPRLAMRPFRISFTIDDVQTKYVTFADLFMVKTIGDSAVAELVIPGESFF